MAKKEKVQKDKRQSTKHTHKTKDRVTWTPLNTEGELRCSGRVSSSCSTSGTRRVYIRFDHDTFTHATFLIREKWKYRKQKCFLFVCLFVSACTFDCETSRPLANFIMSNEVRPVVGFTPNYAKGLSPLMLWARILLRPGVRHYVIKFFSDMRQIGGFLRVLRFPPPIKLTAMI